MSGRTLAAAVLLIVSVSASVSTGLLYSNAKNAVHDANRAAASARQQRKLTDLHLCAAINVSRRINNRDRQTFVRVVARTKQDLRVVKDPQIRSLLRKALAQSERELAARPKLKRLQCVPLIQHPPGKLPPALSTTTNNG